MSGADETKNADQSSKVGRGRPPEHGKYKPGRSGNEGRSRTKKNLNVADLIEREFARLVVIHENGVARRVPVFEVIVRQLTSKASARQRRATSALLAYNRYAASRGGFGGIEIQIRKTER